MNIVRGVFSVAEQQVFFYLLFSSGRIQALRPVQGPLPLSHIPVQTLGETAEPIRYLVGAVDWRDGVDWGGYAKTGKQNYVYVRFDIIHQSKNCM